MERWPTVNNSDKDVMVVVQRNGRKIGVMEVEGGIGKEEIIEIAKVKYQDRLADASSESVTYAKGRVLNFVINDSIKCE